MRSSFDFPFGVFFAAGAEEGASVGLRETSVALKS